MSQMWRMVVATNSVLKYMFLANFFLLCFSPPPTFSLELLQDGFCFVYESVSDKLVDAVGVRIEVLVIGSLWAVGSTQKSFSQPNDRPPTDRSIIRRQKSPISIKTNEQALTRGLGLTEWTILILIRETLSDRVGIR